MHEFRLVVAAAALVAAMVLAERVGRRERLGAVILVLISIAWFTVDKHWEITVLVRFSHSHGLAATDLIGIAGLLRGVWQLVRGPRHRDPEYGTEDRR